MTLRVLHLVGSAQSQFHADLSRLYAQGCLDATREPSAYEVHIAYVTPDRRWRFPSDLGDAAISAAGSMPASAAIRRLGDLQPDLMVPQMFCLAGMTHYRALFDLLGIPYLGNPPDVMALTAHKARARAVVAAAGVRVPPAELLRRGEEPTLGAPTVVKPVDTDNSLGVALVRDPVDYPGALARAFSEADEVLVEAYVELGREVRCGIVVRGEELICLPLEEYAVPNSTRTYEEKIRRGADGELELVAKTADRAWILATSDPATEPVWEAARRCHAALGCRGYSLFDFRLDPAGRPWFLEAGLYCSFSPSSVISVMAAAAGRDTRALFGDAVREALGRTLETSEDVLSETHS